MEKRQYRKFWAAAQIPLWLFIIMACSLGQFQGDDAVTEQRIPLEIEDSGFVEYDSIPQIGSGEENLFIRLSDGQAQFQETTPISMAESKPLTPEEIDLILSRLPAFESEPEDQIDFRIPDEVLPPPRTGDSISEPFPLEPIDFPTDISSDGPLEVLRFAPEGEIPIAPFVNVTFNHPMVPLTTIEDLTNEEVPVNIEPSIPGTWRWLGTKTLNFQSDSEQMDRLPMATAYQVTIPAGIKSATGENILEESVEFTFSTPPPTIQTYYPSNSPQPLDPIFFVSFDQRVNPEAVLKNLTVTSGSKPISIKLATTEEIEGDKYVNRLIESAGEGRWLAFRSAENLPSDSDILVTIEPGTPSAEGPLTTVSNQSFSFRTFAPLQIVNHGCYWGGDDCRPLTPFYIEFNNPIDPESYEENMLVIEPELPGASISIFGNTLQIRGASQGQTTYKVTVSKNIQDTFGQPLGEDTTLKFKVGPAEPVLVGPNEPFITLDPASQSPALSLYTINYTKLDLKIYAVQPSDWDAFKVYLREYQQTDKELTPPGKLVLEETKRIESTTDSLTEVEIEFNDVMESDFGHFIVIAKPPKGVFQEDRYWETVQVWVQITQIGLDAFVDHTDMVVWANALANGAPLKGITIESDLGKKVGTTDSDGLLKFSLSGDSIRFLVARQGDDASFLPPSTYFWGDDGWSKRAVNNELRWYAFDDRQMYRPGEEVHIKGWIRQIGGKQNGDVNLVGSALTGINYQVFDPQGNEIGGDQVDVNALGGFDFHFMIPENSNLGYARIEFSAVGSLGGLEGRWHSHGFQIQEFRRPEFEVTARNETTGPYFVGDSATVAVEAKYYAGGPLPNAEVNWLVTSSPTNYNPPNWSDFSFGIWRPWWNYYGGEGDQTQVDTYDGTTDSTGNHFLNLDFENGNVQRPFSVIAEGTVMDVNRQAWAGRTSLLVHPANLYVGLKSERYFVERGTPFDIQLIVTDLDGITIPDRPIRVTAARIEWRYQNGTWAEEEKDIQECIVGSLTEAVSCAFETSIGGQYRITAEISDTQGRKNISRITRWVSGGELPPSRNVEKEEVTIIPDKETYQPGDVAELLVQSPFGSAEGLLTVSRSGILYMERFTIDESTITLEIPIETKYIPNLNIQVDLVGLAQRTDDQGGILPNVPERPAYASGNLTLSIPPHERTLTLEVKPNDVKLEPGGETTLALSLMDASGNPITNAELAVVVVDEAILALTNYQLVDPISVFYQSRPSDVNSYYSRASILLADPQALADAAENAKQVAESSLGFAEEAEGDVMMMEAPAAEPSARDMAGGTQAGTEPISVRSDFNPLATFAPETRTDEFGKALIEIKLPDNLTRYRIMAVAVDTKGNKFGTGEANITARLPLMVRPSAPRFLNFGDTFELPIVIQNQTDGDLMVDVAIQAANLELTGEAGVSVLVPANDRIEVRFPSKTEMVGTARFQVAAVSGDFADAAEGELPIYTPATSEAFATYGVIDEGSIIQPIGSPSDVFPQFGGLEIQTSSTALQALTDAVMYLSSYPFECSEQLASRILGIAALRDVLSAFEAEGLPSPEAMESGVDRDIDRLRGLQNWDGGFPYWRRGQDSIPFNTIHVAHALQRAKIKGFEVPTEVQQNVLNYLKDIESHYPSWYSKRTRQTLSAYAVYVRNLMGDRDPEKARNLIDEAGLENLTLDSLGWIWGVLVDDPNSQADLEAIRRHVNNRAVETAGAANFITDFDDQTYLLLGSNRRTDAILLDSLIADNPNSDLIPKLVTGLLGHRVKGRWSNTQENVFVLVALDRYFNTFEAQTPDFVARIWLGDTYAGEHEYSGRTTERHKTEIPMPYLVDPDIVNGQTQNLVIDKDGIGRLYYRLGLKYAPTDLWLDPLDMGFVVQRSYEAIDDPKDIHRDDDGVWHIKAGARVRVKLMMVADNRRYHVALVDPLPAGLEIINPALAVSGSTPQDSSSDNYRDGWWWWYTWYEHQNMRDERAEAFTSLLWDGVYEYSYVARATTPGTFIVPPAKAEEMYSPEVFGRSASDWVIIE